MRGMPVLILLEKLVFMCLAHWRLVARSEQVLLQTSKEVAVSSDCSLQSLQKSHLHVSWRIGREDIFSPRLVCNNHNWQVLESLICEGDCLLRDTVEDASLWVAASGFSALFNPLDVVFGLVDVMRICASWISAVLPFALEEVFTRCESRAYP